MSKHQIKMTINGRRHAGDVEARVSLSDFLRDDAGYTGVHVGCEHGVCGACTVIVDGSAVRSCLMLAVQADGAEVMTAEGLAALGWHAASGAAGHAGGACAAMRILHARHRDDACRTHERRARASEAQMLEALSGHICRCTGYQGIRRAAKKLAADRGDNS